MKENEDVWDLWQCCMTQWRMGWTGPVGLDYAAVFRVADLLGVPLSPRTLHKIRAIERWVLDARDKEDGRAG